MPSENNSSAMCGMMPKPPAEFSPLAITRSMFSRSTMRARCSATTARPGCAKISPIKRRFMKLGKNRSGELRSEIERVGSRRSVFQTVVDLLFSDHAFLDEAPPGLGDIDSGGAAAGAGSAVQHQVDAAVHHSEGFDATAAGGLSADVGTGGDQRLSEVFEELLNHRRSRLA